MVRNVFVTGDDGRFALKLILTTPEVGLKKFLFLLSHKVPYNICTKFHNFSCSGYFLVETVRLLSERPSYYYNKESQEF